MRLFTSRFFLPLFITQFLGAFNDNLLKNALVMLIAYRIAEVKEHANLLVTLAGGIFILPFFLASATAGQLADKYDRGQIARIVKLAEIGIMFTAALGFYLGSVWLLMGVLFCMGMHSTFFGPIKYALLPQHLHDDELMPANSYIEAGTFLAILLGTILGGVLIMQHDGSAFISVALMLVAVGGYFASRHIPAAPAPDPTLRVNANIWQETWRIVAHSRANPRVFLCILGISWFWLVGAVFLSQFAPYVKDALQGDPAIVTLFLTLFSVGIGAGSFLCNMLLKGRIASTYVPLGALGITLFGIDLYFASSHSFIPPLDLGGFLSILAGWRILADLFLIAMSAGVYIVPLYAIMQHDSDPAYRARIIAANNIVNALFMVAGTIATVALLAASFTIPQIFLIIALANGFVAIRICAILPQTLLKALIRGLLSMLYHVEVKGLEHFRAAGERVLIVANHTSFLDAALIAAFLPGPITFAVNTHISRARWLRPILALVDALPLDPSNPLAIKALIERLRQNRPCMIFPEGRITVTGALMKIYEGPGMIADKAGAMLLPVRIDGAQYSPFSRLKGKVRIRWFPKITLTLLPPHRFHVDDAVKGRKRRQVAGAELYDIMTGMMFESGNYRRTLFASLLDACHIHGRNHVILEDSAREPLRYGAFLTRVYVLGRFLRRAFPHDQTMGLLLPNAITTAVTFFALQATRRVSALLNFTAGGAQMASACVIAGVKTVLTSRRFIETARLGDAVAELEKTGVTVFYLEEAPQSIRFSDKLLGLLASYLPDALHHYSSAATPDSPAVILFTSGSEGTPKGVALSHANIGANCCQLASRIDFGPQDIVFNALPLFHAFGLTAGTLLPLLSGIRAFYYPSPLHYRIVPELVYDTNSTILFGTDTFLSGYARFAHPYDFHSVRYVFAGAEKLKEETRRVYSEKFGVRIFEGYGATETTPVISINTPMQNRPGTVGRFMPSIGYRMEAREGIEDGAQLWVKGPNIMLGYLRAEHPGMLVPPPDGWYDTGDIVSVDAEGFITIKGRTKRFAKIAGEMVSLAAVEDAAYSLWPDARHAAVALPDARKGEQIILLTDKEDADKSALIAHFKTMKMPDISVPKTILPVRQVPLLGTGKIDYRATTALAAERMKSV